MMRQKCILVLGMHRSGTSALTGVLSFLDIYIGADLMRGNESNPKGYFENNAIYEMNQSILYDLDCSWHDLFYQSSIVERSPKINDFIESIKDQILKQYENAPIFAIKDPRIVYLLPAYAKAFGDLDIEINVIIPYRNPLEVALSLQKRDQFSIEKGLLLWLMHIIYAEIGSRNYKRWFLNFDDLLSSPDNFVSELSLNFDLDLKTKYQAIKKEIRQFLTVDLKHFSTSAQDFSENIPQVIHKVYELLENINTVDQTEKFDRIHRETSEFRSLFYCDEILFANRKVPLLTSRTKKLEAKINEVTTYAERLENKIKQLHQNNEAKIKDREAKINEVTLYAERLENKTKQLHQNIIEYHNDNNHLKNELSIVYLSKSWRYTRIIRKLKRLF